jgi:hypothetical protein
MRPPEFITFTGVDANTPIRELVALSQRYPIEWGVLFSPSRHDDPRYPCTSFVFELMAQARSRGLRLAAHLCGNHSRNIFDLGGTSVDGLMAGFQRAQINSLEGASNAANVRSWAAKWGVKPILQCRDSFPVGNTGIEWLFDPSGGRGVSPQVWPKAPDHSRCGYAGGMRPENVAQAVSVIGRLATRYWIDMETGVRDEKDHFSVERCRLVCEAVFGRDFVRKGDTA